MRVLIFHGYMLRGTGSNIYNANLAPALVRLGRDGAVASDKLAAVQQEHMPTGEHRNFVTPFPDWVDDATGKAADKLTLAAAHKLVAI